ncbi:MAG: response regulator transcription factor [Lachnospiraceae bacterium]|nr:response regulator transcription factor [Lachnospiraceae bacterium]
MGKILIVEDDKSINELMVRYLKITGHNCLTAFSGGEALSVIKQEKPDLILLDINLPDINGFEIIKLISGIPIIYVTARSAINDRVKGLDGGAEDYIVKPFDFQELIARVNVVLRRYGKEDHLRHLGETTIDLKNFKVYKNNNELNVTKQEFELLHALITNKNVTMTRQQLLNAAWGWDYEGDERTVDVHIQRLRKKLNLDSYIKTIYKIGYRLEI